MGDEVKAEGTFVFVKADEMPTVNADDLDPKQAVRPHHYDGDGEVDCMRAMRSMAEGYDESQATCIEAYWALSAVKYLWRAPLKGEERDYEKAARCCRIAAAGGEEPDGGAA